MSDTAKCRRCGYEGEISTFEPTMSPYSDVRCPECGSTNNQHNSDYMSELQSAMKKHGSVAAKRDSMTREQAEEKAEHHRRMAVTHNRCEQCQKPWHDGLCECPEPDPKWQERCEKIAKIGIAFGLQ